MEKIFIEESCKEKFEIIRNRMFNIKHSFNLFINTLENDYLSENSVEIITYGLILKEYFNQTKEKFNELEQELNLSI